MTMILTCVTMVRRADVLDSDRGDFRRRRAVDISSFECALAKLLYDYNKLQWSFSVDKHMEPKNIIVLECAITYHAVKTNNELNEIAGESENLRFGTIDPKS